MADSIFTKIIDRELPACIVYEDDTTIAFLDIAPVNKGHTLVVPKKPFENLFDGDDDGLADMIKTARKLAPVIKDAVNADGVTLVMNNGAEVGQEVMHAHLHIIPRFKGDGSITSLKCNCYEESEAHALATQIQSVLAEN